MESQVRLRTEVRGQVFPDLAAGIPTVRSRVGIDVEPVDLSDTETHLWLKALIWLDRRQRAAQFDVAARIDFKIVDPNKTRGPFGKGRPVGNYPRFSCCTCRIASKIEIHKCFDGLYFVKIVETN